MSGTFRNLIASIFIVGSSVSAQGHIPDNKPQDPTIVLQAICDRLNRIQTVQFTHTFEMNYASQSYHQVLAWTTYQDFTAQNQVGIRHQFINDDETTIYNGSESIYCDPNKKTIDIRTHQDKSKILGGRHFTQSVYALMKAIPFILDSENVTLSVSDSDSEQDNTLVVTVEMRGMFIRPNGALHTIESDDEEVRNTHFRYLIEYDRNSYLPISVTRIDSIGDSMKTIFSDWNESPEAPDTSSWYSATYRNQGYNDPPALEALDLVKPDDKAPAWTLPTVEGDGHISLSDYAGNLLLVEFWFAHCGGCISAVPKINALLEDYGRRGLKVVGINALDTVEVVEAFKQNNKTQYPLVSGGNQIAIKYGTRSFPTAVLIDENGVVIYAGRVEEQHLRDTIEAILSGDKH